MHAIKTAVNAAMDVPASGSDIPSHAIAWEESLPEICSAHRTANGCAMRWSVPLESMSPYR